MNKKHDYDLILDLYFKERKSMYRISKILNINKSTVGYVINMNKDPNGFRAIQTKNRQVNRGFKIRYENLNKLYNDKLYEIEELKKQLNGFKQNNVNLPLGLKND